MSTTLMLKTTEDAPYAFLQGLPVIEYFAISLHALNQRYQQVNYHLDTVGEITEIVQLLDCQAVSLHCHSVWILIEH